MYFSIFFLKKKKKEKEKEKLQVFVNMLGMLNRNLIGYSCVLVIPQRIAIFVIWAVCIPHIGGENSYS
jgi:hypothetical protein